MFDQILSMPFTRFQYVLSNIFTITILGLFTALVTVLIGLPTLVGHVDINFVSICYLVFAIISCSVFFGSIVITISIRIESLETLSYQLESGLISSMFIFLILSSPIFYPLSLIQEPLSILFKLNPLTYFNEVIRKSLIQEIDNTILINTLIFSVITYPFILSILFYFKSSKILH